MLPLPLSLSRMGCLVLVGTLGLALLGGSDSFAASRSNHPATAQLSPGLFSEFASGVVLIRGFSCSGVAKVEGSGFLVGDRVVMTARHVVDPPGAARDTCRLKVELDGHWVSVKRRAWWYDSQDPTGRSTDLATLELSTSASPTDHVFDFRNTSPHPGSNLAMIGHPLGAQISLNQGRFLGRIWSKGHVPLLAIRMLGAEGSSGSPIMDDHGHVTGVLQLGLGGQETSGYVLGIDLPSWWGTGHSLRKRLCQAYPKGGIAGCPNPSPTPPPPPPPPTSDDYTVDSCWAQFTGGAWSNVVTPSVDSIPIFANADLLQNGPANYWSIVKLTAPAEPLDIQGVTVSLIDPAGNVWPGQPSVWTAGTEEEEVDLNATNSDGTYFFQNPALPFPQDAWQVEWTFPDGEYCDAAFEVS